LRRNACQGTFLRSVGYTVTDLADRRRRRDMGKAADVRRSQHLVLARIYGRRPSFNSYHSTVMVCLIQHLYSFHGEEVWANSVMAPYCITGDCITREVLKTRQVLRYCRSHIYVYRTLHVN
jgi:hypothetical protein